MNQPNKQQLVNRIIDRLQADSLKTHTASTSQLKQSTTQLIDKAKQLNAAFLSAGQKGKSLP